MIGTKDRVGLSEEKQYLSQQAIFQDLAQAEMDELIHLATVIQVAKGHILYRPEEASEKVHLAANASTFSILKSWLPSLASFR